MPDETLKLQDQLLKETGGIYRFMDKPLYNIDDMDDRAFMRDHRMEGVYVVACAEMVDETRPGTVYVNDMDAGAPIVSPNAWGGGCSLGFRVRQFIREYGVAYNIRFEGAYSSGGKALPPFCFRAEKSAQAKNRGGLPGARPAGFAGRPGRYGAAEK